MTENPNESISFKQLHRIAGYVEAGEGCTVSYGQDDATKSWIVSVGKKAFRDSTLAGAFEKALADSNEYYRQSYCMGEV